MFDVCTSKGPSGLWLSPNLYGGAPISALLEHMHIKPETTVKYRVLDPLSRNRDYTTHYSQ